MTWLNWSLKLHSGLRTIPHLILTHNTQDFDSINAYLIYVMVHVQMWCVCSNTCWSNPKRFLSVLYVFESDFVLSCFQFLFKMHFCVFIKTWFRGCFTRSSRLRASREMCLREIKSHIFHTETLATASRVFRHWPFLGKWFLGKNWIFHKITQKLSWLSRAQFATISFSRKHLCFNDPFRDYFATSSLLPNLRKMHVFSLNIADVTCFQTFFISLA